MENLTDIQILQNPADEVLSRSWQAISLTKIQTLIQGQLDTLGYQIPEDEFLSRAWQAILSVGVLFNLTYLLRTLSTRKTNRSMRTMACIIFTLVCSFRSFFPRVDAERLCFWDLGLLQSPFVGRSCATVAEIAFAFQFTRYWNRVVSSTGLPGTIYVANLAWFLCSFAQCLCWTGVLTTNNFWHAFENSLWGISPGLLSVGAIVALFRESPSGGSIKNRAFLLFFSITGPIFCCYLAFHDVPMYIQKWKDGVGGGVDLSITDGLYDSMRCIVSKKDELWAQEMSWMSGYFLIGVFISIKLEEWDQLLVGPEAKKKKKA